MLMDSDGFLWILMVRISGYGDFHGANFRLWKFASAVVPFKWSRLRASQNKALAKVTDLVVLADTSGNKTYVFC